MISIEPQAILWIWSALIYPPYLIPVMCHHLFWPFQLSPGFSSFTEWRMRTGTALTNTHICPKTCQSFLLFFLPFSSFIFFFFSISFFYSCSSSLFLPRWKSSQLHLSLVFFFLPYHVAAHWPSRVWQSFDFSPNIFIIYLIYHIFLLAIIHNPHMNVLIYISLS